MMAAADTAMALAIVSRAEGFRPCTTVQLNSNFLKPLSGQDAIVQASIVRAGKSVCRTSTTYALL